MNDISIVLICLISFPFILFILRIIILSWKYFLLSRQLKATEREGSPFGQAYWNSSSWVPYCVTCYPQYVTVEPPLVDYTYTYIYYCLLLMLLVTAVVCIKLYINRRKQLEIQVAAQRRRARRQADNAFATSNSSVNINDDSTCHMGPKTFDSPPAYVDVMQPQLNAKPQSEEGTIAAADVATTSTPANNNTSNGISTITIETEIPSNVANTVDINNVSIPAVESNHPTQVETNVNSSPDILAVATNTMDNEKSKDHIV